MKTQISNLSEMSMAIRDNLANPQVLEKLYNENKSVFKQSFNNLFDKIPENDIAKVWFYRLQSDDSSFSFGKTEEWIRVIILILVAGTIAKMPDIFSLDQENFLSRNAGFIIFPLLVIFYYFKGLVTGTSVLISTTIFSVLAIYMNAIPMDVNDDVFTLVCLHMPVLMWGISGYFRNGNSFISKERWIEFLRFHGDFLVLSGIILLSGFLLTAISVGLFELVGWKLEDFITGYWLVWGLPAVPLLATFFLYNNPETVRRISPLIARVFTPIALLVLTGFVVATFVSGENPYYNREFLQIFNVVLLGVMALIFFSLSEGKTWANKRWYGYLMIALGIITIVVNSIAVSAIIFRITSWGFTPNRIAILGSNLLMLFHLIYITYMLILNTTGQKKLEDLQGAIVFFLPVYFIWAALVVFLFPFVFTV